MISKLLKQIRRKRASAKHKGLDILETEKLALIALASPHWQEIGVGKGKFNICRKDHSKGYIEGNVFIGPAEENVRERNERCGNPSTAFRALTTEQRKQRASLKREAKRRAREQRRALEKEVAKYYKPTAVSKTLPKAVIRKRLIRRNKALTRKRPLQRVTATAS